MRSKKQNNDPAADFILPSSPWLWIMNLGLLLIVAATALPLFHVTGDTFRWIFSAGALLAIAGRLCAPGYRGTIVRVRRLARIEMWACIVFCAGAFFMWYDRQSTDWLAFTLAGGLLEVYVSLMIPRTLSKEMRQRGAKPGDDGAKR